MKTGMQELWQRIAGALARVRTSRPDIGANLETRLLVQGVQAGSAAMLETVLDWIDEIAEGDSENYQPTD